VTPVTLLPDSPLTFATSTSAQPGNSEPATSTTSDRGRETFGLAPRTAELALVARGLQCAGRSVIFAETLSMIVGKSRPRAPRHHALAAGEYQKEALAMAGPLGCRTARDAGLDQGGRGSDRCLSTGTREGPDYRG
jgi:hypothetical protein